MGFPGGSDSKESACNVGDLGSVPRLGRSPGGGHDNPLHILAWRIPRDRGSWQATVHRVTKSQHNSVTHTHTHTPGKGKEIWFSNTDFATYYLCVF